MVFVFVYFNSIVISQLYMYVCYAFIEHQLINQSINQSLLDLPYGAIWRCSRVRL